MAARLAFALSILLAAQPGAAPERPTRLFASDEPIRFTLRGPIRAIAGAGESTVAPRAARLSLASPAAEEHAILLSPRGLSRRRREACDFTPLRVQFSARPAPTSLFERQRRLKLVTHCRASAGFQQHVLLEYAAYRLFNRMSARSLRARLASIDYVDDSGRPIMSRIGFFIEDVDDAARRNGTKQLSIKQRISASRLNAADAARVALFQYMIGNLDWSMRAGPAGDNCCHNVELIAPSPAGPIVPVPYDFDSSGLVNPPYAEPPEGIPVASLRERRYRGHCIHNREALAAAAEFRARRGELIAVLGSVPGLDQGRARSAAAYLEGFFSDIADDERVTKRLLNKCIA